MKHRDASTGYNGIVLDTLMHRREYNRRGDCDRVRFYSFGNRKDTGQSADVDGHEIEFSSPERIAKIVQNGFSR